MTRLAAPALLALTFLAACGAESPPERPEGGTSPSAGRMGGIEQRSGLEIGGSVTMGVNG